MRETEYNIETEMEILSLMPFPIVTLLFSKFSLCDSEGLFYFRLKKLSQLPIPGLALDLLSEAMHSFLQGVFVVFPRQHAVTFFFLIIQLWDSPPSPHIPFSPLP